MIVDTINDLRGYKESMSSYRTPVKYSGLFFRMTSQTPQTIYREKADDEQISNPLSKFVFERTGAVCVSLAKSIDS